MSIHVLHTDQELKMANICPNLYGRQNKETKLKSSKYYVNTQKWITLKIFTESSLYAVWKQWIHRLFCNESISVPPQG